MPGHLIAIVWGGGGHSQRWPTRAQPPFSGGTKSIFATEVSRGSSPQKSMNDSRTQEQITLQVSRAAKDAQKSAYISCSCHAWKRGSTQGLGSSELACKIKASSALEAFTSAFASGLSVLCRCDRGVRVEKDLLFPPCICTYRNGVLGYTRNSHFAQKFCFSKRESNLSVDKFQYLPKTSDQLDSWFVSRQRGVIP